MVNDPHKERAKDTVDAAGHGVFFQGEQSFAPHDRAEINRRLELADIPFGDLNTIAQFLEHPQLTARDRWRTVDSPAGPLQALLPPFSLEDTDLVMGDIPAVGAHTDAILSSIGYSSDEIARLRQGGNG